MNLISLAPRTLFALIVLLFSTIPAFAVDGCSTPDFKSPAFLDSSLGLGGPSQKYSAGDFDGDGKIDLAVTDANANSIGIMLNKGGGSFGAIKKYVLGTQPREIAAADFNGDTRLDLAVTTLTNNLFVLFGMPGGQFATPIAIPVGTFQEEVIAADFNNDTKLDLAMAVESSKVAILLGNGNGSFTAATGSPFLGGTGSPVHSMASADLNSDGKLDLAVATDGGFFTLFGSGLGEFGPPQMLINIWGLTVATGDLNNDGKVDIALGLSSNLAVAFGNGNGTFTTVGFDNSNSSFLQSVAIADMDGDNNPDIAVSQGSPSGISYFKGNGSNSFTQTAFYIPASDPESLVVADFDNDSDKDIVSGSSLLLNSGSGQFNGARSFYAVLQQFVGLRGGGMETAVADFNVDGRSDMALLTRRFGIGPYTVTPLIRAVDGNFVAAAPMHFPLGFSAGTSIEVADFNNDTFPDLAVAGIQNSPFANVVIIRKGNGNGTFSEATTFIFPSVPVMTSVDLNNDGFQDLVLVMSSGVQVMLGAIGGFNTVVGPSLTLDPSAAVVTKLDADNNPDLVITDRANKKVITFLGTGNGSFGTQRTFDVANFPTSVAVGDFNGDSKKDLAVTLVPFDSVQLDGHVAILLGDGTGNMGAPVSYVAGGQPSGITTADFDNDGKLDLAVSNSAVPFSETLTPAISILSGDGSGSFFPAVHFQVSAPGPLVSGDFNNDGRIDLAAPILSTTAVAILYGNPPVAQPCLFADDVQVPEANPTGNVTVRLSEASSQVVSVNYRFKVLGPGATEDVDFTVESGTVVFQPGETSKSVSTTILGDALHENTEGYSLILSMPQNARISDGVAKVEIVDDDPIPTLSINDVTVTEGNDSSSASITVSLSAPASQHVFVNYATAAGTATDDYSTTSGTITIAPGETSQTISIGIFGDRTNEPTETFFVNLTNPVAATIQDSQGQITILDNDPVPTVSIQDRTVSEISAGNSTINTTVTLSNPISVPVSVNYATADNTATAGSDYTAASGTLTFAPGETQKTLSMTVLDDTLDEISPETFFVNLSNPTIVSIADAQGVYSIFDNDGPTVSISDASVVEGNGGQGAPTNLTFTVSLSAPTLETVLVRLSTSNGTAVSGSDYQGVSDRTVQIPVGSTSVTTNILIAGDMAIESTETFVVNLAPIAGATIADGQAVGTITDDDVTSVQFTTSPETVNEADGSVTVNVLRVGDLSQPFTAFYSTQDFQANSKSDFTTAIGLIHFAAGESTKTITIFITNDVIVETPEMFFIGLAGANGAQTNSPSLIVLMIVSDDVGSTPNPVDSSEFFVRQHYRDFLNRDPDPEGLAFWVNEIESCGSNAQCREVKRINVSAAFFLSIEFQETGYLAYRTFKATLGDATSFNLPGTVPAIRLANFLFDAGRIGQGVQVGVGNWQQKLEDNKTAYFQEFVQQLGFDVDYPDSMSAEQFVDRLDQRAGSVLSPTERSELIAILGATPADVIKRALVLRRIAEDTDLTQRELNRAFVLMQYYGYLRRNPYDFPDNNFSGWKFWLDKLNQANGNFIEAEMVKAFITSIEYRNRFAP